MDILWVIFKIKSKHLKNRLLIDNNTYKKIDKTLIFFYKTDYYSKLSVKKCLNIV